MRRHSFSALVTLDPVAPEGAARCDSDRTRAGCLREPGCYAYFPAVISLDGEQPARTAAEALVTVVLGEREARALFAPGQRFTIWADAVVGDTIQARGLVGYGVISQPVLMAGGGSAVRSVIAVSAGCAAERGGRACRTAT